ncbi:MAG: glucitol/sorbitol-specific PTS transporter subunit IIC [Eubacteriales bacterium]|nr:glucitol/sorbitol-specific PTS transporter subunit IIC [Eubacteriales bacterium]
MNPVNAIQSIMVAGTEQLLSWVSGLLPQVFLFLILLNAVTRLIGRSRVERLAAKCGSNAFLRYLVLPFLSAIVLGNPMAISMGRYLPERYKPAYYASASYHCHTNSGIFQHINPAELFIWLGIANGILACGLDPFPLAVRYLCAGLVANFISGYSTEFITKQLEKREHLRLHRGVHLEAVKDDIPSKAASASAAPSADAGFGGTPAKDAPVRGSEGSSVPVTDPEAAGTEDTESENTRRDNTELEKTGSEDNPAFHKLTIVCGDGGYGGPLTVEPTESRHTVLYMTGGGIEPEPLARILKLSGMTAVNGNKTTIPDEEVALAIIDCGGTLRCGIYPGKGIPTVNLMATGRSGPLAKYMTEDLYVSAVTSAQVSRLEAFDGDAFSENVLSAGDVLLSGDVRSEGSAVFPKEAQAGEIARSPKEAQTGEIARSPKEAQAGEIAPSPRNRQAEENAYSALLRPAAAVSRIVSVFHQSARDAVRTCLEMLLPFMGFAALFVGFCRGSGLTSFLASRLEPMGGSLPGLMGLGILCSTPGLSAVLGAGAVAAQMFSTVIGDLIATGSIPPSMALPALFAINCQCACDFIPVGLSMTEARQETTQVGITAVTLSRFATGWIRILVALLFSIGLYR